MPRLQGANSFGLHCSLALPRLMEEERPCSTGTASLGTALPEIGHQQMDPLLERWGSSREKPLRALMDFKLRPHKALLFPSVYRVAELHLAEGADPTLFQGRDKTCAAAAAATAYIHPNGRHAQVMMDLLATWLEDSPIFCP